MVKKIKIMIAKQYFKVIVPHFSPTMVSDPLASHPNIQFRQCFFISALSSHQCKTHMCYWFCFFSVIPSIIRSFLLSLQILPFLNIRPQGLFLGLATLASCSHSFLSLIKLTRGMLSTWDSSHLFIQHSSGAAVLNISYKFPRFSQLSFPLISLK